MGHCRYCGHRAGWLRSSHRQCAATYRQSLAQLVDLVVAASGRPDFTQRRMLRILDGLAQQCYVPADYLPAVLAAGWHLSDMNRMVDDVLTQSETARLRVFRDGHHPASETTDDPGASILAAAARAALATRRRSRRMERVANILQRSGLSHEEGRALLLQAWETAVARQLGDVWALTWTGRPRCCTTPSISTWTMPSWTITGCCASSFRVLPLPKPRPV